jgi:hypothetical protein
MQVSPGARSNANSVRFDPSLGYRTEHGEDAEIAKRDVMPHCHSSGSSLHGPLEEFTLARLAGAGTDVGAPRDLTVTHVSLYSGIDGV